MTYDRAGYTASVLKNGKVLIAGGYCDNGDTAELYDPSTGNWTIVGKLRYIRWDHTTPILKDGRALVVSGERDFNDGSTAELYDPLTGRWTMTGNLSITRFSHTASVLIDGKVLVTGGINPDGILESSELYDPSTGEWTFTGNLNHKQYRHVASVLRDGKVLVLGGLGDDMKHKVLSSAELYDPSTGLWISTSYLEYPRFNFAAVLLSNGKVLAIGGLTDLAGGITETTEIYHPSTGFWNVSTSLNTTTRYAYTASLLEDGNVLVVGGANPYCESTAELYQRSMES